MPPRGSAASLLAAILALWPAASTIAAAQTAFPDHPIRIVAPFPAGAPVDIMARLIADRLEKAWGLPVVVENRSGGGGIVGSGTVARAAPDGYTLLFTSSSPLSAAPALTKSLLYDPVNDFAPIWGIGSSGLVVVVNPSLPINTLAGLVQYAGANPNKLSFASSGHGTTQHLAGELFMARTGVKLVHVPYRGGFAGQADLIAGHVQVMFDSLGNTYPSIKAAGCARSRCCGPSAASNSPMSRPRWKPACAASTWSAGSACSRRPRRRRRSWASSPPRWCRP
jgi:tripartite-type tricarboxylate transporter receptor subunit TctC